MSDFHQEFPPHRPAGNLAASLRQDFDHEPSDDELVAFVHPEGLAAWLRVAETPREIRVEPGEIPLWFVAICLLPALAAWGWVCQRAFARGLNGPEELTAFVLSGLAFPATIAGAAFLNRHFLAAGTFCIADLVDSKLELPRLGLSLSRRKMVRLVEYRGWRGDREKQAARELSVIVKNDRGAFSRCQVVIGAGRPVTQVSQRLAEAFGLELTIVKG